MAGAAAEFGRCVDMSFTSLLIAVGIYGGVFGYPVIQVLAIVRLRGGWRILALLPLFVMIPVTVVTFVGFYRGSNLWPIYLIFVAPVILAYFIVLLFVHAVVRHSSTSESSLQPVLAEPLATVRRARQAATFSICAPVVALVVTLLAHFILPRIFV